MGGTVASGSGGGSPWIARQTVAIEKDFDKLGSDQKYTVQKGDTCWNMALALKANNSDIKMDTKTLAEQLEKQAKISQGKDLKTGTVLDLSDYTPKKPEDKEGQQKGIQFADSSNPDFKKQYVPGAVSYMRMFDKNNDQKFDAKELSQAYGVNITDNMLKNLDLPDASGKSDGVIDLKEATLGLMMEDKMNNAAPDDPKSQPDGKISTDEQNAFLSAFQSGADQFATQNSLAGYQANQFTLNQLLTAIEPANDPSKRPLTDAVNQAYQNK
jgi:ABC-type antimicrobial peptide transport system permease subunit